MTSCVSRGTQAYASSKQAAGYIGWLVDQPDAKASAATKRGQLGNGLYTL
jgi:hypothetical protein